MLLETEWLRPTADCVNTTTITKQATHTDNLPPEAENQQPELENAAFEEPDSSRLNPTVMKKHAVETGHPLFEPYC